MNTAIKLCLYLFSFFSGLNCFGQGNYTNIWQLGYVSGFYPHCEIDFSGGTPIVSNFVRPMNFRAANSSICDASGNLLFYTNGIYIANANHDTMMNGSGLNPGQFATAWSQNGMPIFQGTLVIPWPDSSNKYILFHETRNYDINVTYRPKELYVSVIDMNLDSGLGAVTNKNIIVLNDTIEGQMLTGCRHANGRDWWVLVRKYQSETYFKFLITPVGISSINTQSVSGPISEFGGSGVFSPDGNWYATFDNISMLRLYQFDRCSGDLNLLLYHVPPINTLAGGLSFSPNSGLLYASSLDQIFQYDLLAPDIAASETLVATYDGHFSPWSPLESRFLWHMLGPDGRIYISSLSGVIELNVIASPDNPGLACDVQQHSLNMGSFNVHSLPNHINYNLKQLSGSPCDTLGVGIYEHDFEIYFSAYPNPSNGSFKVNYLLPQNKSGKLEILDINGKRIHEMNLPPWSTMQFIQLPKNISSGVYSCILTSGNSRVNKKLIVINE